MIDECIAKIVRYTGSASQKQRLDEGLLPENEALDVARAYLFRGLDGWQRHNNSAAITQGDVVAKLRQKGCWVPSEEGRHAVFESVPAKAGSGLPEAPYQSFLRLKVITVTCVAAAERELSLGSVRVEIEPHVHRGTLEKAGVTAEVVRYSARVAIWVGTHELVRWYAL